MSQQKKRNEVLRLLDPMKRHNYFGKNGFNTGNSYEHELTKFEIAYTHRSMGHDVVLEAFFKGGDRCDVLCLDERRIYEVLVSENEASLASKKLKYPEELTIEEVRV